ncbi:hypothetical protein OOJ91_12590 [Micromonospora lupini]|uniref:hypothetical protein n=1 Tax=Micromonospora lupini TaxID=285679 RepID=UPI002258E6B1|nr:hypothetical protein [Micromonospora lupini]MCX5066718.1 hypothetical protein [Micromonospora lupini]
MAESIEPRRVLLGTQTLPGQRAGLRGWITRRQQRRSDQRKYAYHQEQLRSIRANLSQVVDAGQRADLLLRLASTTHRLGVLHRTLHGIQRMDDEPRSKATSLLLEGGLYHALSVVELSVVYGTRRTRTVPRIERAAGLVLDRMAATPDLIARTQLLDDLHDAVVPVVGKRAATAILALPLPAALLPQAD